MRLMVAAIVALIVLLGFGAAPARAAAPTVDSPEAVNIQGVSALLKGTVDPEGLETTYRFDYIDAAGFAASGFAGASSTPTRSAGSGSGPEPARAAISGLTPSTTYHFRLVATNAQGTAAAEDTFTTTQGFGFLPGTDGFGVDVRADGGEAATLGGSHPHSMEISLGLRPGGAFEEQPDATFPDGDIRDLTIELPRGMLLSPAAVTRCSSLAFQTPRESPFEESRSGESCPDRSQVGTVEVQTAHEGGETRRFGVFNLEPTPGVVARLGFSPYGAPIVLDLHLIQDRDGAQRFRLKASDIPQRLDLSGLDLVLWGVPWNASHNGERGDCLNEAEPEFPWAKCSVGSPSVHPPQAYIGLPTECDGPLAFTAGATSWQQPSRPARTAVNRDSGGNPAEMTGCGVLAFDVRARGDLTAERASAPSGYTFRLINDHRALGDPSTRIPAMAKRAVVTLPSGVTLNPSVGAGLSVCRPGRLARETPTSPQGAGCPNASRIGSFSFNSLLFEESLDGAIFLAAPRQNPFGTLLAIYLVAKLPERGVMISLAGRLDPHPRTGRLVATFDDLPQLPYTDLRMAFRAGQRSFLATPPRCGNARSRIEMAPWSGGPSASAISDSPVRTGADGGACPSGAVPFEPQARAGGVNARAGAYTPYFIRLSRRDTEQQITSYSLTLPEGVTGKLAGIPFCSEQAIARARTRSGFAEERSPSCPAASRIGRTETGYGVGPALTYAPGAIYLAGPYRGRPLSVVTINAATVGPFDLGTIVIRSAFEVDPVTAQLRIEESASDAIPHILEGIPLHLREIRINVDRPEFTRNPTSCEPSRLVSDLTGSAVGVGGTARARATSFFQLLDCRNLDFRPKLGLNLRGGVRRGAHPSLRATFIARGPQDANLRDITVSMPQSLFLAQNHIRGVCTRAQFAAENCPADSVYGHAAAVTPLFDEPLHGPVYLRSSDNPLPDLVASLRSGEVRIVLTGRIGSSPRGGIRTSFFGLPDAPIERFAMRFFGGNRGLLVNSTNICEAPPMAAVRALGQSNLGTVFASRLQGQCQRYFRAKRIRERREARRQRIRERRQARRQQLRAARRAGLLAERSASAQSAYTASERWVGR